MVKFVLRVVVPLVLGGAVVLGALLGLQNLGLLSVFGTRTESHDSQVIRAVERTQEVSLLRLAVQGILEQDQDREVFGKSIPGTGEKVLIQYEFDAKLGVDGAEVSIKKTDDSTYLVRVPEFVFIGYDDPTFKTAAEDGGVLSWVTPDIDKVQMINKILNGDARQKYLESNTSALEEQTRAFYGSLIGSIDPDIAVKYEFASSSGDADSESED